MPYIGLSTKEAQDRIIQYGKNVFIEREKQSAFSTFLEEFKSPLIIMLIVAAIISFISGSTISGVLILVIILASSCIDFVISYKSQKAADALANQIMAKALVIRDGVEQEIPVSDIVPGDIAILQAGSVVPADGIVVEGHDFYTNESSLTGESAPVEKLIGAEVYLGSGVVSGRVKIEVQHTGYNTKFANIVALLQKQETPGEFERGIAQFSYLITRVVIFMTVFVFVVYAIKGQDIFESLIFALALAVGITPELLPMIIALNVSKASIRMSHKGVIVKKLSAIENFGGMNILCTDKTGTLTEDKITVVRCVDIQGNDSDELLQLAYIDSSFHTGSRSPLDEAIVQFKQFDISLYKKIDEIPFDFERRRDSIAFEGQGKRMLISKGSPESILDITVVTPEEKIKALALFESLSQQGYRVLGVAMKTLEAEQNTFSKQDEQKMQFGGFITFIDPPKQDVKEVLLDLEKRNIEIKVITGDHRLIAEQIASQVGLVSKGTVEASEVDSLSDEELSEVAEKNTLFVRVTPLQKNKLIAALQRKGNVVGYMGDGINDAPALRTADVGISVNNAVDVAKEAADIILLSKSLQQLVDGVVEGRRTLANTVKYITMAVSSNFGNMFSMTGASLVLPFLPMLPTQILLNNLLYESSQFALTFDNVDEDVLNKPHPWNISFIKKFMFVFGAMSSIFDFLAFFVLYKVFSLSGSGFQTGWFIESFASQTLVIFLIRSRFSIFSKNLMGSRAHKWVVISSWTAVIIAWIVALTSLGKVFGFATISTPAIAAIIGILIVYYIAVEITKYFFYRKFATEARA
ncbi:MAG: magnesium-translocating P-type ATPase [Candidatus Parcubacteria bacterium]|jgi:Mg2+-importing ATPase